MTEMGISSASISIIKLTLDSQRFVPCVSKTLSMFDFEKLQVYRKAKTFHLSMKELLHRVQVDRVTADQLSRASFSVVLNIAEGSGRFSKADRRNFFVISRSSIFECIAILDVLKDESILIEREYKEYCLEGESLSKMLFAMIKNLKP